MISFKNIYRRFWPVCYGAAAVFAGCVMTSCSDFFEQDSDRIIYADNDHLNNATDTIYSVTGVISKLQAIADRTILLGEVRGDLVDVTNAASSDLRDVAQFSVGSDNQYNRPADYYAVINNCNYFIAKADTALRNSRNQEIFAREYSAIKCYRAWTYLQLALNYGRVPFVTEPILTKEQADRVYPMKDIQEICEYFIQDLMPLALKYYPDDLDKRTSSEFPMYGTMRNTDSRLFYFPVNILLGELNLWAGHYKEAALRYYAYINNRNGANSSYPTTTASTYWNVNDNTWNSVVSTGWFTDIISESYGNGELITMIPCDSIPSEGNYSQLRYLFNSEDPSLSRDVDNNFHEVSLVPSTGLQELSESQQNCVVSGRFVGYAPMGLSEHRSGDLRLGMTWSDSYQRVNGVRTQTQTIYKYSSRNVHLYRRTLVYLRMAEALNCAGYPRFAFQILASGLNNDSIAKYVTPYYTADSTWIKQFDFPSSRYNVAKLEESTSGGQVLTGNMLGIHSRGSGFTPSNEFYRMPMDSTITDSLALRDYQMDEVEKLIVNEGALEFAFEGTRFYDLMRVALRRNDPAFLADRIYGRRGIDGKAEVQGEIKKSLYNTQNWYLDWNGKIGMAVGE